MSRARHPWWRRLPFDVALAVLAMFAIKAAVLQVYLVPSGSMEHTLNVGDRVIVNRAASLIGDPIARGDVVVFKDPGAWLGDTVTTPTNPALRVLQNVNAVLNFTAPGDRFVIKRVIGLPGDQVRCCTPSGALEVNGHAITEPYLYPGDYASTVPFDVTVPAGTMWVMGDHRSASADSRFHTGDAGRGFVPLSNVVGRASAIAWPANRIGLLTPSEDLTAAN